MLEIQENEKCVLCESTLTDQKIALMDENEEMCNDCFKKCFPDTVKLYKNPLTIAEAVDIIDKNFLDIHSQALWKEIREEFLFDKPNNICKEKYRQVIAYLNDKGQALLAEDVGAFEAEYMSLDKRTGYVDYFNSSRTEAYREETELIEDSDGMPVSGVKYIPGPLDLTVRRKRLVNVSILLE